MVKHKRIPKKNRNRTPDLRKCPQKKGYCMRVYVTTPRKPNSALRKVTRVLIMSTNKRVACYIRGIGHSLQKYSAVLLQGGNINDLPGVRYRLIRGKYDFRSLKFRKTSRSKYGTRKIKE